MAKNRLPLWRSCQYVFLQSYRVFLTLVSLFASAVSIIGYGHYKRDGKGKDRLYVHLNNSERYQLTSIFDDSRYWIVQNR